jgi:CRISPR system Cascade subunit CasD
MKVLVLRLEGPLQAWSAQGKLGIRDTEREPTKSGVIGLLGAALGMPRTDEVALSGLASLKMGVRVDRAGALLRDYHTAGGGTFRGGKRYFVHGTKDCVPSERYYLQDASFVAALAGDDTLVLRVATALESPRYTLFLGRRSCPPSVPVLVNVVEGTIRQALASAPLADHPDDGPYRVVLESGGGEGDVRDDVPLSFAQIERRYGRRYVTSE